MTEAPKTPDLKKLGNWLNRMKRYENTEPSVVAMQALPHAMAAAALKFVCKTRSNDDELAALVVSHLLPDPVLGPIAPPITNDQQKDCIKDLFRKGVGKPFPSSGGDSNGFNILMEEALEKARAHNDNVRAEFSKDLNKLVKGIPVGQRTPIMIKLMRDCFSDPDPVNRLKTFRAATGDPIADTAVLDDDTYQEILQRFEQRFSEGDSGRSPHELEFVRRFDPESLEDDEQPASAKDGGYAGTKIPLPPLPGAGSAQRQAAVPALHKRVALGRDIHTDVAHRFDTVFSEFEGQVSESTLTTALAGVLRSKGTEAGVAMRAAEIMLHANEEGRAHDQDSQLIGSLPVSFDSALSTLSRELKETIEEADEHFASQIARYIESGAKTPFGFDVNHAASGKEPRYDLVNAIHRVMHAAPGGGTPSIDDIESELIPLTQDVLAGAGRIPAVIPARFAREPFLAKNQTKLRIVAGEMHKYLFGGGRDQAAAVLIRGKYPQQQKAEAGGEIDAMRAKMAQYERLQEQRAARQREIQALIDAMQGKGRQPSVREQVA